MKTLKTLSIITALSLVSGIAFAQINKSSTFYYFTQQDPTVHEQFSCAVTGANDSDRVLGLNSAEMITGFDSNGKIKLPVSLMNSVYFDAYHDPNKPNKKGFVYFKVGNSAANIQCYQGKSAPGDTSTRTLIPGPYGINK